MSIVTTKRTVCDAHQRRGEDVDAQARTFTLSGRRVKSDLCDPCAEEAVRVLSDALDALAPGKTRRGGGGRRKSRKATGPSSTDVRQWAREHGVEVAGTGRIPRAVVDQYLAAQ